MRYAVVVDAGSSGSRAHVYSWPDPGEFQTDHGDADPLRKALLPIDTNADWAVKVKPGISTYAEDTSSICSKHIGPLLEKASEVIPREDQPRTPLFFLATAGMRLLPEDDRKKVLSTVCGCLRDTSFHVPECATHVTMIDGEVEGIYGWLGLNYLVNAALYSKWDKFDQTYGFMDMGGASAQIAFVPDATRAERHEDDLFTVRLRSAGGEPIEWKLFVATWLEFGANEALTRLREKLVSHLTTEQLEPYEHGAPVPVLDPCMPLGALSTQVIETSANGKIEFLFSGSGSYESCTGLTIELLNKGTPCKDNPCLFDGVHVPDFDFEATKFVGVSEYWYTLQDIFANNGSYDQETLEAKVRELCNSEWSDIKEKFESGQLSSNSALTEADVQRACFKSAWVLTVLDKGYSFPLKSANPFGDPHNFQDSFQSAINVEGAEISWTLGRAVLYASSSVPALSANAGEVGHALYKQPWVPGGELTELPWEGNQTNEHGWVNSSRPRWPFAVLLAALFAAVALYIFRRNIRHYISQLKRKLDGWHQVSSLPVSESPATTPANPFSPYASQGFGTAEDTIALQEFRLGMSTVTPTSNVPSRVSSRANLRSEWDH